VSRTAQVIGVLGDRMAADPAFDQFQPVDEALDPDVLASLDDPFRQPVVQREEAEALLTATGPATRRVARDELAATITTVWLAEAWSRRQPPMPG
jgi:hypothetical protein